MLGLRLDEPLPLAGLERVVDRAALERMVRGRPRGRRARAGGRGDARADARAAASSADAVTAELLA